MANDFYCWWGVGCVMCYPGTTWCDGNTVMECAGDGQSSFVVEVCDELAGEVCNGGICITLCEQAEQRRESIGCKFYGIDMAQYTGYDTLPYAITVSNVHDTLPAQVDVQTKSGGNWTTYEAQTIQPQTLYAFNLPNNAVRDTTLAPGNAYRVISNIPVIAYQFNPLDTSSMSTDASLLLPASAFDTVYLATGWGSEVPGFGFDDTVLNVVAEVDGTQVTITPSANTAAGGPIPAGQAGVPMAPITLDEGDVLQLINDHSTAYAESLEGTLVEATERVAVFGGHCCANVPDAWLAHVPQRRLGLDDDHALAVGADHALHCLGASGIKHAAFASHDLERNDQLGRSQSRRPSAEKPSEEPWLEVTVHSVAPSQ